MCVGQNKRRASFYRSQHELVIIYKRGTASLLYYIELGKFGRNRCIVWSYRGVNAFGKDRDIALAMHPTVKPLALVTDAICDCSNRGGIVLDPFSGSGTTLLAAEQSGRRGYGIELDPYYVDTALRRFRDKFGVEPRLSGTHETFTDREHPTANPQNDGDSNE